MAVTTPAQHVAAHLAAYQRRIRRDRLHRYLAGATVIAAALWVLFAVGLYYDLLPPAFGLLVLGLTLVLPLAALLAEALRRPSPAEIARLLDGRLDNQQRWLTAVELLETAGTPMQAAQLATTARSLAGADPHAVYPLRPPWPTWAVSGGLLLVALGLFLLRGVPDNFNPFQAGGLPPTPLAGALPSPTPPDGLPGAEQTPEAPLDGQDAPPAGEGPGPSSPDAAGGEAGAGNAAQQLAASRDAQAALERLARALNEQSVTQEAADQLRQGNYDAAAKELEAIGAQSDQLSPDAKQSLAAALDAAARDSTAAPNLSQAETATADALRGGNYRNIEQRLRELGAAIRQTGGNVVPQEELAQSFPAPPDPSRQDPGSPQADPNQPGQPDPAGQPTAQDPNQAGQSDQPGDQGGSQSGDQPGSGPEGEGAGAGGAPGTGPGSRVSGPQDPQTVPEVPGNPFELESRPDPGQTRPAQPDDPPALTLEGDTGSSSTTPLQPGSAATTPGETHSVPVERWNTVQRYFSPDEP